MTVGSDLLKKNDEAARIDAVGSGGVGWIGARNSSQQTKTEAV